VQPPLHDIQIDHGHAFVQERSAVGSEQRTEDVKLHADQQRVSSETAAPIASAAEVPKVARQDQALGGERSTSLLDPYKFEKNLIISGRGSFPKETSLSDRRKRPASATSKTASVKIQGSARKGPGCPSLPGAGAASDGRDLGRTLTRSRPPLRAWNRVRDMAGNPLRVVIFTSVPAAAGGAIMAAFRRTLRERKWSACSMNGGLQNSAAADGNMAQEDEASGVLALCVHRILLRPRQGKRPAGCIIRYVHAHRSGQMAKPGYGLDDLEATSKRMELNFSSPATCTPPMHSTC